MWALKAPGCWGCCLTSSVEDSWAWTDLYALPYIYTWACSHIYN